MKMSTSDHHHSSFIDPVSTTSQVGQSSDSSAPTLEGGIHNRRFRGPTVISEVANLPPNKQLNINWNKYGQPIGHKYNGFTRWLGILSRNGRLAPLDHDSWHHVPLSNKNEIWNEVKIKWNIDEERQDWVMKSIGASWKEWKKRLKKEHFNRYLTNEERLAHCPDRVEPTHWKWLVNYWSSDEGQVYAPISEKESAFHRTLFIFMCTSMTCLLQDQHKQWKRKPEKPSGSYLALIHSTQAILQSMMGLINHLEPEVACSLCIETIQRELLALHKGETCPQRIVTCKYCEFPLPAVDLCMHQDVCGNQTDYCDLCNKYIRRRGRNEHYLQLHSSMDSIAESSRSPDIYIWS